MAHKKGGGSSRNNRDSNGQRLGVKRFGGEYVTSGSILIRQRGTPIFPGANVGQGKDDTIYARQDGFVTFEWAKKNRRKVSVYSAEEIEAMEKV